MSCSSRDSDTLQRLIRPINMCLQVLHAPELPKPESATLLLSQVVINGLDKRNMSAGMGLGDGGSLWEEDDSAPFIVVFQYGRSVWAGFPVTRVRYVKPTCMTCGGLLDSRIPMRSVLSSKIPYMKTALGGECYLLGICLSGGFCMSACAQVLQKV